MHDELLFLSRLFLGVPFIIWGYLKLRGGEAKLVPVLKSLGLPDPSAFAFLVGLCELAGGLMLVLGYPIRTASVLLGLWCLITGYAAHRSNLNELLLHVTSAGGYFALAVAGAGSIALFGGVPTGIFEYLP